MENCTLNSSTPATRTPTAQSDEKENQTSDLSLPRSHAGRPTRTAQSDEKENQTSDLSLPRSHAGHPISVVQSGDKENQTSGFLPPDSVAGHQMLIAPSDGQEKQASDLSPLNSGAGYQTPTAQSDGKENQTSDLLLPRSAAGHPIPVAQSDEKENQTSDILPPDSVAGHQTPGAESVERENQSMDLPPTASVAEGQIPSAQLGSSLELSNPTAETRNQIPKLNKATAGIKGLLAKNLTQFHKFSIPEKEDLHEINTLLGGDWKNLALVISTDDNTKMIGIPEREAEHKIKIHFAVAREKQKKNLVVPYDVTFNDLITRIEHLLSADIHWLCLAYCLKDKACVEIQMISRIYKALPDFDTFWSAFSMPHYDFRPEVAEQCQQNGEQEDKNDNIFTELKALRTEVEEQDAKDHLPQNFREEKKFCKFICQDKLLEYALSLNNDELSEKFKQLSQMKIDPLKWKAYLDRFGISPFKKKEPANHHCIEYGLNNPDFWGEQVIGKNKFVGSLGWPLKTYINQAKWQITSSHVLLNENRFKELGKEQNLNEMVKLEHTRLCKIGRKVGIGCDLECYCFSEEIIGLIIYGCYRIGNNISSGVEIVVIDIGNQSRLQDVPADLIYYQWKTFGFPDKLCFRGQLKNYNDIEQGLMVYKLGNVTGLTRGRLISKTSLFEFDHPFSQDKKKPSVVTLDNQYEVAWDPGCPFSKEGDSGGPVFTVNRETGEITALGILTGNNEKREVSFVTPLDPVLSSIGTQYNLKSFEVTLRKIL